MANDDSGANHGDPPQDGFLSRHMLSTDHKTIGLNYLWLALFSVFLGMVMSLLMRIHLVWPGMHLPLPSSLGDSPDRFVALTTLHGSLMVFLVLTAAPQAGFGNYFLPLQIGAREMAFPTLNLLAFWATVASLLGLTTTFLIPSHPAITLWIVSVSIFCAASLCNALNFSVTTIDLRAQGVWQAPPVCPRRGGGGLFRFCCVGHSFFLGGYDPFFAAVFFRRAFSPRTPGHNPPAQLVWHTVGCARAAQHRHAFRARF